MTKANVDCQPDLVAAPRRLELEWPPKDGLQSAAAYLARHYADSHQEVMGALYLNLRRHLLATEEIFRGTISGIDVEPRPILVGALRYRATALILYHNHPSGDPTPSAEDIIFTRKMVAAGEIIDVLLIEHLILGRGEWVGVRSGMGGKI